MAPQIRTYDELSADLIADFKWRRDELGRIRLWLREASSLSEKETLTRAGIALLYAHWEGYVKYATETYYDFVARRVKTQKHSFEELSAPFRAIALYRAVGSEHPSGVCRAYRAGLAFLDQHAGERASLTAKMPVGTGGNLSFAVLAQIMEALGLDAGPYQLRDKLIDERLLGKRNKIAHGEYLDIDEQAFVEAHKQVLDMMVAIKDQILAAADTEVHLRN